jgi:enoyl-CoA hydratase/carnithine racemase
LDAEIVTSHDENVGFITINRPQLHNAISLEMWNAIPREIEKMVRYGSHAIIFTGEGDAFASGADLGELRGLASTADAKRLWDAISFCLESIWNCPAVTIAMVHGSCIGGGCLLAAACDFRLASIASFFAIPVARLGLMLDDRTVARLVNSGGPAFAREILLAGATMSAHRAEARGFIHRAVELNKLRFEATELAKVIAGNSQASVHAAKRSINHALSLPDVGSTITYDEIVAAYLSDEFKQRVGAIQ